MFPPKRAVALAILAAASIAPQLVLAQSERVRDEPREGVRSDESEAEKDPLRGSTLLFDQNMSTQTAHLEPSPQQSDVPSYGLWLSLRPRWSFNSKLRVQARFDYYKELTNSQNTTYLRENVVDDLWTDLIYSTPLAEGGRWKNTRVNLGARALWPTSKQSQAEGIYLTLGATAGVKQTFPLRGEEAHWLNSAYVSVLAAYLHPFSAATTATQYGGFAYVREDVDLRSFRSDQLTGQTLVNHKLYGLLESGLQITPKLGVALDLIWIEEWHYLPTDTPIATSTGAVRVPRTGDQQLTQLVWVVAEVDYSLLDEVTLGLGYYNLTNALAADGTARGPFSAGQDNLFWSPDARVYFDVTLNLDKIFEDLAPRYRPRTRALTGRR
ncbi:MAG: hypothetical protein M3O36_07160 [Myxococcota bacterium]|nr:hypothetical protein [Myxococcota bacterium]